MNDPTSVWLSDSTERTVRATAVQADGKVVIAGSVGTVSSIGVGQIFVGRLNADGTVDTSFGADGFTNVAVGPVSIANAVAIQPDGRIVVGGVSEDSASSPTNSIFALVRFNADGSVDTSFGSSGIVTTQFGGNEQLDSLAIDANGNILAVGAYTEAHSTGIDLARYTASGVLDPTFATNGTVTADLDQVLPDRYKAVLALQPDGKILVGTHGKLAPVVLRYNTDGTLDSSFGTNGIATVHFPSSDVLEPVSGSVGAIAITASGQIAVAAVDISSTVANASVAMVELTANGQTDTSFGIANGETPIVNYGFLNLSAYPANPVYFDALGLYALQNGDLVFVGQQPKTDVNTNPNASIPLITALTATGAIDSSFASSVDPQIVPEPYYIGEVPRAAAMKPDGSLFVAFDGYNASLLPYSGSPQNPLDLIGTHWGAVAEYAGLSPLVNPQTISIPPVTTPPSSTPPGSTGPISGSTPLPAGQLTAVVLSQLLARAAGGAKGALVVQIKNAGVTAFAGPVSIDVYESTDGTLGSDDAKLTTLTIAKLSVKAGKTRNVHVPFNLSTSIASGRYYLLANVTETGKGTAAFTAASHRAIAATAASVDMGIVFTAKTLKLKKGKTAKAVLVLRNLGNVAAIGIYSISLASSASAMLRVGDPILGSISNAKLNIAAKRSKRVTVSINPSLAKATAFDLIATLTTSTLPNDTNAANDMAVVGATVD